MGDPDEAAAVSRAEFAALLTPLLGAERRLALAVSGGCDSTALLLLAADLRRAPSFETLEIHVATVDHGLRAEAAAEAASVGALCRRLGLAHTVLKWAPAWERRELGGGNLQAAGREARYALLADWRAALGVRPLALAHTQDDVAETFLMRLARGSGVDGLAQMAEDAPEPPRFDAAAQGLRRIRPLLSVPRRRLQATCGSHGAAWTDDPTNDDARFLRIRARAALRALEPLGVSAAGLAATAARLRRARSALDAATAAVDAHCALGAPLEDRAGGGALFFAAFDAARLAAAPEEVRLRLLSQTLRRLSGAVYPPRFEPLAAVADGLLTPAPNAGARTLHGCALMREGGVLLVCREPAAVAEPLTLAPGDAALWDGRFAVRAGAEGVRVGALGPQGAAAASRRLQAAPPERRALWRSAPIAARRAAPALWPLSGALSPARSRAPALAEGADLAEIRPA